ncbi:hypothetical protein VM1G_00176 [Cytospora mali]|uniref:BRCT domain-containing protein n=1 Tax=Cytospora mali TaxID=578113 RepID=A0A194VN73_CYTMA|nr:hypothetical protein VM1G_00176 [Valsa mali]
MDKHLAGVRVCVAGDLNIDAGNDQWTDENIKRWLEARGGKFVEVMDDSVTHLLCSTAAFEAKKDKFKYAKRLKHCKIVTYEWLEDGMLLYDQLKRKAPVKLYDPGKVRPGNEISALYRKRSSISKKVQAATGISGSVRKKDDENTTDKENEYPAILRERQCDLYRIYKDPTDGFPYQVEVSCPDKDGNPRGKRWILQLLESKATPRLYIFSTIHFKTAGAHPISGPGSDAARLKDLAIKEFQGFFFSKTGIMWKERLLKASAEQQHKDHKFRYYPPAPGEPAGYVHPKYMPGKADDNESWGQGDSNAFVRDARKSEFSLKRKRDDLVESQLAKPINATRKKTTAFDDVNASKASRF